MNETTIMSDWTENEQLFAKVIIDVVESKHEGHERDYREGKYQEPVPLTNIHFGIENFENNIGIPHLQEIAKRQGNPCEEWKVTAQRMLDLFCCAGEIEKYSEGIYKLSQCRILYGCLKEKLAKT